MVRGLRAHQHNSHAHTANTVRLTVTSNGFQETRHSRPQKTQLEYDGSPAADPKAWNQAKIGIESGQQ